MIEEHDVVALTIDLPEHGLQRDDLGTVVMLHGQTGFEVEFTTLDGKSIAVLSLGVEDVRRTGRREIAHARAV